LMTRQPVKKFTTPMSEVTLGCTNYVNLIKNKVPEFTEKSVICLDSDAHSHIKGKNYKTIVLLPGEFPPDQLIFQHLYNLPAEDKFWQNELQFTRDVFTNAARDTTNELKITGSKVDLDERIKAYKGTLKPRDIFKKFYKGEEVQKVLSCGTKPYGAWRHWIDSNPVLVNQFLEQFKATIYGVMKNSYAVDDAKLTALKVTLKKVPHVLK
jgi:hypothetical protein